MDVPVCTPVSPPPAHMARAAAEAVAANPINRPALPPWMEPDPGRLAMMTSKYWGAGGARLTVGFLEPVQLSLRERLLAHMNAWSAYAAVEFVYSRDSPVVRVTREGEGYWSYVGTDNLTIPAGQPTMCLEAFTNQTPESEFVRVVRHEAGHAIGLIHEHLRRELVALLDPAKTVAYFARTQGWSEAAVYAQVLTPVEDSQLMLDSPPDQHSIMAYSVPGECTFSGLPVAGGADIDAEDARFAARVYPRR